MSHVFGNFECEPLASMTPGLVNTAASLMPKPIALEFRHVWEAAREVEARNERDAASWRELQREVKEGDVQGILSDQEFGHWNLAGDWTPDA